MIDPDFDWDALERSMEAIYRRQRSIHKRNKRKTKKACAQERVRGAMAEALDKPGFEYARSRWSTRVVRRRARK